MKNMGKFWFQYDARIIAEYLPRTGEVVPVLMPLKTLFLAVQTAIRGTFR